MQQNNFIYNDTHTHQDREEHCIMKNTVDEFYKKRKGPSSSAQCTHTHTPTQRKSFLWRIIASTTTTMKNDDDQHTHTNTTPHWVRASLPQVVGSFPMTGQLFTTAHFLIGHQNTRYFYPVGWYEIWTNNIEHDHSLCVYGGSNAR